MSTVRIPDSISVEEYLEGEMHSSIKHEYFNGQVYAMVGAKNVHNIIASNLQRAMGNRLEDSPCREFNSDTKVRIQTSKGTRFYYPDAMVVCKFNPQSDPFQDNPVVLAEVLSSSTRRTDEGEKLEHYCKIPSLNAYLTLETDLPHVVLYQRVGKQFERTVVSAIDAVVEIAEPSMTLSMKEIYRDVRFETDPQAEAE